METRPSRAEGAIISGHGLVKAYGSMRALDGVDVEIGRGEIVAVIGPSGSGKSTLIRCLNGLEELDAGSISFDGSPVPPGARGQWQTLRKRVGMIFQDYTLFPHLTVLGNIILAPVRTKLLTRTEAEERGLKLLVRVGLDGYANAYPAELSGGQQQRVAIVRALAMAPDVLLLDEPTSALDPEMIAEVLQVVRQLSSSGMTLVIVTHEIGFARDIAHRIIFMDFGRIVEAGPPHTLFDSPQSARLRDFLSKIL